MSVFSLFTTLLTTCSTIFAEKPRRQAAQSPDSEEIGQRMQAKVLSRSYWAVNFKSHWAPGTVESPAGPSVTVYDDTGEAEVFDAL